MTAPGALRRVCVFSGSSTGTDRTAAAVAAELGEAVAARGLELVYGGGQVGLMGVVADAALSAGGRVVGVIPKGLFSKEIGHDGLTELHEVDSMHARKTLMYDLADAFVALPGGLGTLEELAEITTWAQLGLHQKPVALLDVGGFWSGLTTQLDRMVSAGFLRLDSRRLVRHHVEVDAMLDDLASFEPSPRREKWIEEDER